MENVCILQLTNLLFCQDVIKEMLSKEFFQKGDIKLLWINLI